MILFTASAAPSAFGTSPDGEVHRYCFLPPIYTRGALYLCAAPPLRTTHYALIFLATGYWSLATSRTVRRFGLVPFTVIPTDRFDKVLRVLKVLRFSNRNIKPLFSIVPSISGLRPAPEELRFIGFKVYGLRFKVYGFPGYRLKKFLRLLRFLRFIECAAEGKSQ